MATEYSHIIHIADIHIRSGDMERSRYNEYVNVFHNLFDDLNNLDCTKNNTVAFVIAGDLFHHKGKLDTPAIKLYFDLMDSILNIGPVFIICGNHDFRQEDPDYPDMISAMIKPYHNNRKTKYNIFYLENTGIYEFNNIGFGVISIKDTLRKFNTSGIIDDLPEFPKPEFGINIKTKIALFHGTITQSSVPSGHKINGYPLDWFKDYDIAMLGDNHKQQYHEKPLSWGYPGSLIQQDFGEPTFGHGYILWDLENKKGTVKHINNNYGMITIQSPNTIIMGRNMKETINNITMIDNFPKSPKIRIIGNQSEKNDIINLINEKGFTPSYVTVTTMSESLNHGSGSNDGDVESIDISVMQLNELSKAEKWIEYIKQSGINIDEIEKLIRNPQLLKITNESSLTKEMQSKINDRNDKIEKAIVEYHNSLVESINTMEVIKLKKIAWDYAMCYGQNNYFDFETLTGKIGLLNGRNASGKSSFLDVLCIGLYGEATKHRNMLSGKKLTSKIINDQKPANKGTMNVSILFTINNELYEIYRSFGKKVKDGNDYAQALGAQIFKINENTNQKKIISDGTTMVNKWIDTHFGDINNLLTSTMMCQIDLTNFFYLKQEEQREILDKALQLGSITQFTKILKESLLAHNDVVNSLITIKDTIAVEIPSSHINSEIGNERSGSGAGSSSEDVLNDLTTKINEYDSISRELLIEIGSNFNMFNEKYNSFDEIKFKKFQIELKKLLDKEEGFDKEYKNKIMMLNGEHTAEIRKINDELATVYENYQPENEISDAITEKTNIEEVINNKESIIKKPKTDYSYIIEQDKKLAKWKNQYDVNWFDDPDALIIYKETLEVYLKKCEKKFKRHTKDSVAKPKQLFNVDELKEIYEKYSEIKDSAELAKTKLDFITTKYNEIISNITSLKFSSKDYAINKNNFEEWSKKVKSLDLNENKELLIAKLKENQDYLNEYNKKISELSSKESVLKTIEDELNEMKDIPFNKDCWACQKQPMNIRKISLVKKAEDLLKITKKINKIIKEYNTSVNIKDIEKQIKYYEDTIKLREFYDITHDSMINENNAWNEKYKEYKNNKTLKADLELMNDEKAKLEFIVWNNWQDSYNKIEKIFNEQKEKIQKIDTFLKEYDNIENEIDMINTEKEIHKAYNKWLEEKTDYNIKLETLTKYINYIELKEKQRLIESKTNINSTEFEKIDKYMKLSSEYAFVQWKIYNEASNKLKEKQTKIQAELIYASQYENEYSIKKAKLENIITILKNIESKRENIKKLDAYFNGDKLLETDGYKEWVYKENVIKLLENEVNKFLSMIDDIRLKIEYDKKGFIYYLDDRGNTPPLDKCSGYQNFITALGIRIALARIGAVGQNIKHLFIDEGFTACDVFNIEKVPNILKGMMAYGDYDSIILMSHLDTVKDATDVQINIERVGSNSYIHWGDKYPEYQTIEENGDVIVKQKRGRPKV